MTLTEFLEARISEDEAAARDDGADAMMGSRWKHYPEDAYNEIQSATLARCRRVLAECAAKRVVVRALAARESPDFESGDPRDVGATFAFRQVCLAFATVHADHPDYDVTWACRLT